MSIFVRMQYFHGINEIYENYWKFTKSEKFTRNADFHANVGFTHKPDLRNVPRSLCLCMYSVPVGMRASISPKIIDFHDFYRYSIHFLWNKRFYMKPVKSLRDWYLARASVEIVIKLNESYSVLDVVQPKDLYLMKTQHYYVMC